MPFVQCRVIVSGHEQRFNQTVVNGTQPVRFNSGHFMAQKKMGKTSLKTFALRVSGVCPFVGPLVCWLPLFKRSVSGIYFPRMIFGV